MTTFLYAYEPLLELALFNVLLAFSQYIVLRAGVFSLGTAAFAAIGAYTAAIMVTKLGLSPWLGLAVATALGITAGAIVAIPLSRLRGVFQALATLALVQIVLSITLNWVDVTNGALGVNSIPKAVGLVGLLCVVVLLTYLMSAIGSSSIGRAFDVIREDETVAVSLGISVQKHHMIAFILSGAIAGLAGALHAYNSYSITPNEYGFNMVVMALAMVVLGGRVSVWGPIVGAVVLTGLPELLRGFQEYRMVVQGILLLLSIIFLPEGVADTLISAIARKRIATGGTKTKVVAA
jgi:branched-chain amino acid transport system permease protein